MRDADSRARRLRERDSGGHQGFAVEGCRRWPTQGPHEKGRRSQVEDPQACRPSVRESGVHKVFADEGSRRRTALGSVVDKEVGVEGRGML